MRKQIVEEIVIKENKLIKLFKAIKEFNGFGYPWNKYGFYEKIQYPFFKKPYWIFQFAKQIYKHIDYYPWDLVNSSIEILFLQYTIWFEHNEEYLKPWLEDGKWVEHKHSENWEGNKGKGVGLKYREMLEIYMYIKYIRKENEKKCSDLLHTIYSDDAYKSWFEDCDEVYDGEKCYLSKNKRLKNFKVEWKYSDNKITDRDIYHNIQYEGIEEIPLMHSEFADNLSINITELKKVSDKYNRDHEALRKIEEELIELDNKYCNKIIQIRQYLWT